MTIFFYSFFVERIHNKVCKKLNVILFQKYLFSNHKITNCIFSIRLNNIITYVKFSNKNNSFKLLSYLRKETNLLIYSYFS